MHAIVGSIGLGKATANAGTIIQVLIRPWRNAYTKVTGYAYTAGNTAHTLTFRLPIGKTTLSAAAAAGQAVVNLTAQPTAARNVAANDFLVIGGEDMTASGAAVQGSPAGRQVYDLVKVSSVSGLAITLTANVPRAYAAGFTVWLMALNTDTVPGLNVTPPQHTTTANTTVTRPLYREAPYGIVSTAGEYEPVVLESNNATGAGTVEYVTAAGWVPAAPRTR